MTKLYQRVNFSKMGSDLILNYSVKMFTEHTLYILYILIIMMSALIV